MMLGLGDYESSSEEEVERKDPSPSSQVPWTPKQQHLEVANSEATAHQGCSSYNLTGWPEQT